MSDKVYTVEGQDGTKTYVGADNETEAFARYAEKNPGVARETLKFSEGKRDDVPEGAEVL